MSVQAQVIPKTLFTIQEVAQMLQVSVDHIYHLTSKREIQHYKIGGKVRMSQRQIDDYIESRLVKSNADIQRDADTYIATHPRRWRK